MKLWALLFIVLPFPLMAAGCGKTAPPSVFRVKVGEVGASCIIEVGGRKVGSNEFVAIVRREAAPDRSAQIGADMAAVPYRCVGGVIYELQSSGFKRVEFVGDSASSRN